jgi:hypothetical protein
MLPVLSRSAMDGPGAKRSHHGSTDCARGHRSRAPSADHLFPRRIRHPILDWAQPRYVRMAGNDDP